MALCAWQSNSKKKKKENSKNPTTPSPKKPDRKRANSSVSSSSSDSLEQWQVCCGDTRLRQTSHSVYSCCLCAGKGADRLSACQRSCLLLPHTFHAASIAAAIQSTSRTPQPGSLRVGRGGARSWRGHRARTPRSCVGSKETTRPGENRKKKPPPPCDLWYYFSSLSTRSLLASAGQRNRLPTRSSAPHIRLIR